MSYGTIAYRVDRNDLEPGDGMRQGIRRVPILLCRVVRKAIAGNGKRQVPQWF